MLQKNTTWNGENDCSGGDDEYNNRNVLENVKVMTSKSNDQQTDPIKDQEQLREDKNITYDDMETDNSGRKNDSDDKKRYRDFVSKTEVKSTDDKDVKQEQRNVKEESRKNKQMDKRTESKSAKRREEYSVSPRRPRTRSMTKMLNKSSCVPQSFGPDNMHINEETLTGEDDMFVTENNIKDKRDKKEQILKGEKHGKTVKRQTLLEAHENDEFKLSTTLKEKDNTYIQKSAQKVLFDNGHNNTTRRNKDQDNSGEENKNEPTKIIDLDIENCQALCDMAYIEAKQVKDCKPEQYVNPNFFQTNNSPKVDDHLTLKDDSFDQILLQIPSDENKIKNFEPTSVTHQNTSNTETTPVITQSKNTQLFNQMGIGESDSGKREGQTCTSENSKQNIKASQTKPSDKGNTQKTVKRLSLGARSIEFAKNKRLSLEMKKKSSTNVMSKYGLKQTSHKRRSLDSNLNQSEVMNTGKLSVLDQKSKRELNQSTITDTFHLRNSRMPKPSNK